jgi:hypothetical protein
VNGAVSSQPVRLLTEREAAEHCRYFDRGCANPLRAFQKWARRKAIPVKRAGRSRLYDVRVLDAFMDGEAWTARHAEPLRPSRHVRSVRPFLVRPEAKESLR